MITLGARLNERLLGLPKPVIAAVNGNAIAAGAFAHAVQRTCGSASRGPSGSA